jgi:hypothetical protein
MIGGLALLFACGPSKKERLEQQRVADSIEAAIQQAHQDSINEAELAKQREEEAAKSASEVIEETIEKTEDEIKAKANEIAKEPIKLESRPTEESGKKAVKN